MNAQTDLWTVLVILGLALITVLTRTLFFLSSKPWHLPHWAQRGLQYAPIDLAFPEWIKGEKK